MRDDEITMRDLMEASLKAIDVNMVGLRDQLNAIQQASAREHAQVRSDLGELRTKLEQVPTNAEFVRFKGDVDSRLGRLEQDLQQRAGGSRARESLGRIVVAGCATAGALCGAIVALARVLIPG
ncbi:hypothetical protein [Conexibacter woesei]|uniref:Uncharacterized protein n=1 Tax=Conexibacter woesei (strain DSM 14684 / CCUG 47730 / CIP 108061 / JCM 11494 / NBRC 100937 / ID131577) TaxID=469383 RepID=D3F202_CONWI|nr:hypothetical protein [Conexibacter woesei]ADB50177.1 hypothetical protein Cwoe_1750 [Conexibacter woesei DSM 14684]